MPNTDLLINEKKLLVAKGFHVKNAMDFSWVCVYNLDLPSKGIWTDDNGNVITQIPIFCDIPHDFPLSPPGKGFFHPSNAIHIPYIAYNGKHIDDLHKCEHNPWWWLCFQKIMWDPNSDNLLTLLNIIEFSISDRTGGLR